LFFKNDTEFGPDHVVGKDKSGDAVGFQSHHVLEPVARDALEEGGIVAAGKRVLLAADCGNVARKRIAGILLGAFEHQMFEKVRQTGLTGRLVGGADLVPDHVGDHRSPMIGHHDDLKAIR